ncbi:SPOR domain-containing protein [Olleya aquimaris]|uniref:Sporulation related protein n=1 Tax=Olleya aquimaris TaxID=639310 RepID=A0A327RRH8_9FLAO|nr:SPOR domain-containing protein [Olleya aquimaris]RAJ18203.1 sporulation related protein [Olleya aquimaris]
MKTLQTKTLFITLFATLFLSVFSYAQQGTVVINEDPAIDKLLAIKKDMNSDEKNSDRYKIQVYSGNLATAESTKSKFDSSVGQWRSQLVFDSPNYKVWVGSFRTRLEADRALVAVQRKFGDAFIFKPKKE